MDPDAAARARLDRRALRAALLQTAGWLDDPDRGPRAVDAGSCDRCGVAPRLLPTCAVAGVVAVCRDCADQLGDDGWCEGHQEQGRQDRAWAEQLPDRWADAVLLWWLSTGELKQAPGSVNLDRFGPAVHEALDR